ncbi:MAG: helix-turn-helix domain-containing protein, partial [Lewinella sp.]|nr:helix-turn-helix domain-containing protein [Lewinella sp.]
MFLHFRSAKPKRQKMAGKPKSMSKVKQILRLVQQDQPIKKIARITGVSRNTVRKYI